MACYEVNNPWRINQGSTKVRGNSLWKADLDELGSGPQVSLGIREAELGKKVEGELDLLILRFCSIQNP